jgi:hypothetical protein
MALVWSVIAVVASLLDAPSSYIVVVPSLGWAAGGLIGGLYASRSTSTDSADDYALQAATFVPFIVLLCLWPPVIWLLYDAIGTKALIVMSLCSGLVLSAITPVMQGARRPARVMTSLIAAAAFFVFLTYIFAIPFTAENPRHLNLSFHLDADSHRAQWWLQQAGDDVPRRLAQAAPFTAKEVAVVPWLPGNTARVAPAPAQPLMAPELRVEEVLGTSGGRRVRARLLSARGAPEAGLALPIERVRSLSMEGHQPSTRTRRQRKPSMFQTAGLIEARCVTVPREGVEVDIEINGDGPVRAFLWDASPGLPPEGRFLLESRPENVCPIQDGDRTLVSREINL